VGDVIRRHDVFGHRPKGAEEQDAASMKAATCPSYDDGRHCTRTLGHRGDHVEVRAGLVVGRWPAGEKSGAMFG